MAPQFPMNHKAACGEAATEEAELGRSAVWGRRLEIDPARLAQPLRLSRLADKNPYRLTWRIPYGCNSHRSRLGRDNRPELFRKTNIANDVAGSLHPIVGRSDPDTVDLFTFLTLSNFRVSFGIRKEYATRSGPNAKRSRSCPA